MNRKGLILTGVTALALLASGAVVASALNDMPQDARPAQSTTADLNRQQVAPPPPAVPQEPAPEAAPAPAAPVAISPPAPVIVVAETAPEEEPEEEDAAEAEE